MWTRSTSGPAGSPRGWRPAPLSARPSPPSSPGSSRRCATATGFWYEDAGFDAETLAEIKDTTLSDLILRHTDTRYLQDDVFTFHERRDAETEAEHPEFPQLVVGTADGQRLEGGAAGDILAGRDGDQELRGEDGDDRLIGGPGSDAYWGGAGADTFRLDAAEDSHPDAPDRIEDFAQGEDRVDVSRSRRRRRTARASRGWTAAISPPPAPRKRGRRRRAEARCCCSTRTATGRPMRLWYLRATFG